MCFNSRTRMGATAPLNFLQNSLTHLGKIRMNPIKQRGAKHLVFSVHLCFALIISFYLFVCQWLFI
jgi:hypothetical protein